MVLPHGFVKTDYSILTNSYLLTGKERNNYNHFILTTMPRYYHTAVFLRQFFVIEELHRIIFGFTPWEDFHFRKSGIRRINESHEGRSHFVLAP
jgi:hypothetical protein